MNLRKLSIVLAVLVLGGGIFLFRVLSSKKQAPQEVAEPSPLRQIRVFSAQNAEYPLNIPFSGRLKAANRIEIAAEVTGVMKTKKPFKVGTKFSKGELLFSIDDEEERKSLTALRSGFLTSLTQILPDIKLDYPEDFEQFNNYALNFSLFKSNPSLPEPKNPRLKLFLSNRNIYNPYYTIKSREERLSKYRVYAPFSGTLSSALVENGGLVRAGTIVGTFISYQDFEMEASIDVLLAQKIKIGDKVSVHFGAGSDTLTGKVIRKSSGLDPATQTLTVYASFSNAKLVEGLFGEGRIKSQEKLSGVEIPRALLLDKETLFIVEDSVLRKKEVQLLAIEGEKAWVAGLDNGTTLVAKTYPNLLSGSKIFPLSNDTTNNTPSATNNN